MAIVVGMVFVSDDASVVGALPGCWRDTLLVRMLEIKRRHRTRLEY